MWKSMKIIIIYKNQRQWWKSWKSIKNIEHYVNTRKYIKNIKIQLYKKQIKTWKTIKKRKTIESIPPKNYLEEQKKIIIAS